MWETLFDPSMLDSGKEIAIWCPDHDDVPELFAILKAAGIEWWVDGDLLTSGDEWGAYENETVYYVEYDEERKQKLAYADKSAVGGCTLGCVFRPECVKPSVCVEVGDLI